jgi:hypothetical protein
MNSSIKFDCDISYIKPPKLKTPEQWLEQKINKHLRDVNYYSKELAKEIFDLGLKAVQNPDFWKQIQSNPELAKKLLEANQAVNTKQYVDLAKKLGFSRQEAQSGNENLQKTLQYYINNSDKPIDESPVKFSGDQNPPPEDM